MDNQHGHWIAELTTTTHDGPSLTFVSMCGKQGPSFCWPQQRITRGRPGGVREFAGVTKLEHPTRRLLSSNKRSLSSHWHDNSDNDGIIPENSSGAS